MAYLQKISDPGGQLNWASILSGRRESYISPDWLFYEIKKVKPNIADSSVKAYVKQINKLSDMITGKPVASPNPDWLINTPINLVLKTIKYKENGEELHITSRRNMITALITYLMIYKDKTVPTFGVINLDTSKEDLIISKVDSLISQYGAQVKRLNERQNKRYQKDKVSSATKEKLKITYSQLEQAIDNMIGDNPDKVSKEDALLFTLITKYHYRNEIGSLELITKAKYDKTSYKVKTEHNYLVKYYNNLFISRGVFKTAGKYKLIKTDLSEDKKTTGQILDYIKNVMSKRSGREKTIVFTGSKGGFMPNELVSQRIGRLTEKLFGVKLGTSSINKIFMNTLNNDTIEELKKVSATRGTSIATLILAYYNKE